MRIVVFEVEDWERDAFAGLREGGHELELVPEPLDAENAAEHADAEVVSTFIYSDLSEKVLRKLPSLRLVATRSTGYDHVALDHCAEHGIAVANVPEYGCHAVAEHVFALLLTISHRIADAIDRTRKGDFSMKGLVGFDLRGRTLGVVGTGSIGRCVIKIAGGFSMPVLAFDVNPDEAYAREAGFEYVELDELLRRSDVVTLHVPANKATHHLLSAREFEQMKEGAVLINTSRGSVIDTAELLRALTEGAVSAAGLDVLAEEPTIREEAELLRSIYRKEHDLETLFADHMLMHLRNVFVTPHTAFNTKEAVETIVRTTMDNIRAFAEGEPRNIVNQ
ncbi:MAG: hydroxyacid dehydrogenase [Candidatus Eisenbacteria bacterium]|nr:hydroxyacid dehydrogenase [Candidatus Eisenbacteria bacterium]